VFIEDLPSQLATAVPAHAVSPDQDRFAAVVRRRDRVLSAPTRPRGRERLTVLTRRRIHADEQDLAVGLPTCQDLPAALRQCEAAHGAGVDLPPAEILRREVDPVVAGDE